MKVLKKIWKGIRFGIGILFTIPFLISLFCMYLFGIIVAIFDYSIINKIAEKLANARKTVAEGGSLSRSGAGAAEGAANAAKSGGGMFSRAVNGAKGFFTKAGERLATGGGIGGALFDIQQTRIEPFFNPELKQQDANLVDFILRGQTKYLINEVNRFRKSFNDI